MRYSVFFALLVATVVTSCGSFASANSYNVDGNTDASTVSRHRRSDDSVDEERKWDDVRKNLPQILQFDRNKNPEMQTLTETHVGETSITDPVERSPFEQDSTTTGAVKDVHLRTSKANVYSLNELDQKELNNGGVSMKALMDGKKEAGNKLARFGQDLTHRVLFKRVLKMVAVLVGAGFALYILILFLSRNGSVGAPASDTMIGSTEPTSFDPA